MASIIAGKSADKQYEIVGKTQNLMKKVQPLYNVRFVGTPAQIMCILMMPDIGSVRRSLQRLSVPILIRSNYGSS